MGTINSAKIGSRKTVAAGQTKTSRWNNPPWPGVLSYTAIPIPPGIGVSDSTTASPTTSGS